MVEFFKAGGFGMWIVLFLGGATLLNAALFARSPDERRIALIRTLTVATIFSVFTAISSDFATVMYQVPNHPEWGNSPDMHKIVMVGLAESTTPLILGSAMLTLAWLVASVGMRRLAVRLSTYSPAAS